ncbi:hypothetical protein BD560DRAFT_487649 [Blakeslea trispora]|nr:hypothetical protein BD560DRAFT_487649 [Blakeslea trispora]
MVHQVFLCLSSTGRSSNRNPRWHRADFFSKQAFGSFQAMTISVCCHCIEQAQALGIYELASFTISEIFKTLQETSKSEEQDVGVARKTSETTGLLQLQQTSYLTDSSCLKKRFTSIATRHKNFWMYLLLIANQQMRSRFILMDCMVLNFLVEDYSVIALSSTGIGVTPAISIVQRRSNGIGTVASSSVNLYWSIRCISKVHNSKQVFKKSYRLPCFLIDEINPFMTTFSRWNQQIWNALLPAKLNPAHDAKRPGFMYATRLHLRELSSMRPLKLILKFLSFRTNLFAE